jgi:hypothetical protein
MLGNPDYWNVRKKKSEATNDTREGAGRQLQVVSIKTCHGPMGIGSL